jgi:hypothetical protein
VGAGAAAAAAYYTCCDTLPASCSYQAGHWGLLGASWGSRALSTHNEQAAGGGFGAFEWTLAKLLSNMLLLKHWRRSECIASCSHHMYAHFLLLHPHLTPHVQPHQSGHTSALTTTLLLLASILNNPKVVTLVLTCHLPGGGSHTAPSSRARKVT